MAVLRGPGAGPHNATLQCRCLAGCRLCRQALALLLPVVPSLPAARPHNPLLAAPPPPACTPPGPGLPRPRALARAVSCAAQVRAAGRLQAAAGLASRLQLSSPAQGEARAARPGARAASSRPSRQPRLGAGWVGSDTPTAAAVQPRPQHPARCTRSRLSRQLRLGAGLGWVGHAHSGGCATPSAPPHVHPPLPSPLLLQASEFMHSGCVVGWLLLTAVAATAACSVLQLKVSASCLAVAARPAMLPCMQLRHPLPPPSSPAPPPPPHAPSTPLPRPATPPAGAPRVRCRGSRLVCATPVEPGGQRAVPGRAQPRPAVRGAAADPGQPLVAVPLLQPSAPCSTGEPADQAACPPPPPLRWIQVEGARACHPGHACSWLPLRAMQIHPASTAAAEVMCRAGRTFKGGGCRTPLVTCNRCSCPCAPQALEEVLESSQLKLGLAAAVLLLPPGWQMLCCITQVRTRLRACGHECAASSPLCMLGRPVIRG